MVVAVAQFGGFIWDSNAGGNAIEEWSCGISLQPTIGGPGVDTLVDAVAARIHTWFEAGGSGIDKTCSLEEVKFNLFAVATPWHQTTDPTVLHVYDTGTVRGGVTPAYRQPFTHSYKVSFDNSSRDRSTKGGFFVPRCAFEVGATGLLSSGEAGAAADQAQILINGLKTDTGWPVVVWSRKNGSTTAINRIRLGRKPDVQRRRSKDILENYLQRSVT